MLCLVPAASTVKSNWGHQSCHYPQACSRQIFFNQNYSGKMMTPRIDVAHRELKAKKLCELCGLPRSHVSVDGDSKKRKRQGMLCEALCR